MKAVDDGSRDHDRKCECNLDLGHYDYDFDPETGMGPEEGPDHCARKECPAGTELHINGTFHASQVRRISPHPPNFLQGKQKSVSNAFRCLRCGLFPRRNEKDALLVEYGCHQFSAPLTPLVQVHPGCEVANPPTSLVGWLGCPLGFVGPWSRGVCLHWFAASVPAVSLNSENPFALFVDHSEQSTRFCVFQARASSVTLETTSQTGDTSSADRGQSEFVCTHNWSP